MMIQMVYAYIKAAAKADDMYKRGIKASCYQIAALGYFDREGYLDTANAIVGNLGVCAKGHSLPLEG